MKVLVSTLPCKFLCNKLQVDSGHILEFTYTLETLLGKPGGAGGRGGGRGREDHRFFGMFRVIDLCLREKYNLKQI